MEAAQQSLILQVYLYLCLFQVQVFFSSVHHVMNTFHPFSLLAFFPHSHWLLNWTFVLMAAVLQHDQDVEFCLLIY